MATRRTSAGRATRTMSEGDVSSTQVQERTKVSTPRRRASSVPSAKKPIASAAEPKVAHPVEEHIRVRAYYLSLERAAEGMGDDLAYWLRAERELRADLGRGPRAAARTTRPRRSAL